jgi:hypothetical protein
MAIATLLVVQNSLNKQLKISPFYTTLYPVAAAVTSVLMLASGLRISLSKRVSWKDRNIKL